MEKPVDRPSLGTWLAAIAVFALAVTIDFVVLFLVPVGSVAGKLSLILGVVGLYSLLVGVMTSTNMPRFLIEYLTSHNLAEYFSGNFLLLTGTTASLANAADPRRASRLPSDRGVQVLRLVIVNGLVVPAVWLYLVFHIMVVLPLAYLAYAPASLTVAAALDSARPIGLHVTDNKTDETTELLGRQWIRDHRGQVTSFAVALPSSTIAMLLNVI